MKLDFVWAYKELQSVPTKNITIGCQISIPSTVMEQIGVGIRDKIDIGFDEHNQFVGVRKGSTYRLNKQEHRFMLRSKKNVEKAKLLVGRNPAYTIQDGIIILHKVKERGMI